MRTATVRHSAYRSRALPVGVASGFTIVEVVVVMVVMAILAAVALPRLDLLAGFDEVAYRDQVKAVIEYARKSAVARRRFTCVAIAADTITLTAEAVQPQDHAGACDDYAALNLVGKTTNVLVAPTGVSIAPTMTIMFDAEGTTIVATQVFSVARTNGDTLTFTVEGGSGYVHN